MRPHRQQPMMARHPLVTVQPGQQRQPRPRPLDLRQGHRPVQRHHRIRRDPLQDQIQRIHLPPIRLRRRRRIRMRRRDRRLQLIRPQLRRPQRAPRQPEPLLDQNPIPLRTVLLVQRHQITARRRPRHPPRVREQHQRQQAGHLPVPRKLRVHDPRQPDRLPRQIRTVQRRPRRRRIPLVEDQIQHVQDHRQPLRPTRHRKRTTRRPDPLLRPADPRRHRRLRHQERPRDLRRRQATHRPQRQRRLRSRRQRRMATQEQQQQRVIGVRNLHRRLGHLSRLPVPTRRLTAHLVDQPP